MRTSVRPKKKPRPALTATGTNSVRLASRPNHADAQRLNLKRAYQAFMHALPSGEQNAAAAPSELWPCRPYAASI